MLDECDMERVSNMSTLPVIVIYVQPFTTDNNWPAGLILDHSKGNWLEWDLN